MCGIVGYIGDKPAADIILKGLQRLEYRGYDSAGIALLNEDKINVYKVAGKVNDLKVELEGKNTEGTMGIGHTRWATHGEPNHVNAHPHMTENEDIAIIHNGIIENYAVLRDALKKRGYTFKSDTDTEVLLHLIDDIKRSDNVSFEEAVRVALTKVIGAYAIVLICKNDKDTMIGARKGSPLVVGVGVEEYFMASDASPIAEYTRNVLYLKDNEIAVIKGKSLTLKNVDNQVQTPYVQELDFDIEALEKGGYEHFMLKEIHEQPESIRDCMRGRINQDTYQLTLGGIKDWEDRFVNAKRIIMIACGTSWHAGLVGEYIFEELARVPVEVEYASEFRYRDPIITPDDIVIAISQSGETADTLAAIELAKEKGATIFGICNVVGSSIARATDAGVYTHAGPEIGVASTKAFTAQVTVLTMMALLAARRRNTIAVTRYHELIAELDSIPNKVEEVLQKDEEIQAIAKIYKDAPNCLYLGRGFNFPVALEGALKLKEISYIHAEGYPAAEMKHGPIALIDESMPVVVLATNRQNYDKVASNVQEVKARKGKIISVVTHGDSTINELSDHIIEIPVTDEVLTPLLSVVPLQLLAYHVAVLRGCNVDQPRNLAKSVTVE